MQNVTFSANPTRFGFMIHAAMARIIKPQRTSTPGPKTRHKSSHTEWTPALCLNLQAFWAVLACCPNSHSLSAANREPQTGASTGGQLAAARGDRSPCLFRWHLGRSARAALSRRCRSGHARPRGNFQRRPSSEHPAAVKFL